jgi:nitric oxide synthase oxygenase domain/subunit
LRRQPELLPPQIRFWGYKEVKQATPQQTSFCFQKLQEVGLRPHEKSFNVLVSSFQKGKINTIKSMGYFDLLNFEIL